MIGAGRQRKSLDDALPAALDRIEQLQAALVEACDYIDHLDGVLNRGAVTYTRRLRALAAGQGTNVRT